VPERFVLCCDGTWNTSSAGSSPAPLVDRCWGSHDTRPSSDAVTVQVVARVS
jgi:hypothetical protein